MATTSQSVERVQSVLDDQYGNNPTDYIAFCALLNDLAHYAAARHWNLVDEASIAVAVAARREAA